MQNNITTPFTIIRTLLAGIILLLGFSYFGCGIKGPPVPPQQPAVPAVMNLAYQVDDQTVRLTWSLPGPLAAKQAKKAAFAVYRSRSALAEPTCEGCPLVFEKVATVAYVHTDTNRYTTSAPLDHGYRYVFKVRLETDGVAGLDSNLVQFDYGP